MAMAVALTGVYYKEIAISQYVRNVHSIQRAYRNVFSTEPITIGCIEADAHVPALFDMFDGFKTVEYGSALTRWVRRRRRRDNDASDPFARAYTARININKMSEKIKCLLSALEDEVDPSAMVLWSRIDIYIEELTASLSPNVHLHAFQNVVAANRLCDNVIISNLHTFRKLDLHKRGSWIPEEKIADFCTTKQVCRSFATHRIYLIKPTQTEQAYLHSTGVRLWHNGEHTRHASLPATRKVHFLPFAATVAGEFRTFRRVAPNLNTFLQNLNATSFACLRNATTRQLQYVRDTLFNLEAASNLPYSKKYTNSCHWHKSPKLIPMWEGIACAYKLMLRYEIVHFARFKHIIRLRTDTIFDTDVLSMPPTRNIVYGLAYLRFAPQYLLCDHFYIAPRYLALGAFHNEYALSICDMLRHKEHCGQLPFLDTECMLRRRIEAWGGTIARLSAPKSLVVQRNMGIGPRCGRHI